jgi:hypothetical protein
VDGPSGGPQKRKFKNPPKNINDVPKILVPTIVDNVHGILFPSTAKKPQRIPIIASRG